MVSSLPHGNLHFSISGKRFTGTQVHGKAHFRQLIIGKTRWVGAFGLHMHCSDLGGRKGIKCTLIGVDMPITGLGKRGRLDKGDDTLNDVENSRPPSPSWGHPTVVAASFLRQTTVLSGAGVAGPERLGR